MLALSCVRLRICPASRYKSFCPRHRQGSAAGPRLEANRCEPPGSPAVGNLVRGATKCHARCECAADGIEFSGARGPEGGPGSRAHRACHPSFLAQCRRLHPGRGNQNRRGAEARHLHQERAGEQPGVCRNCISSGLQRPRRHSSGNLCAGSHPTLPASGTGQGARRTAHPLRHPDLSFRLYPAAARRH